MKKLFTSAMAIAIVSSSLVAVFGATTDAQLRLTPTEIEATAKQGAGAGTSGVAGIETTTLMGDPTKPGLYTIAIHVPANTRIQAHTHRDSRSAVVASGTWYFGYGSAASDALVKPLPSGSFYTEPADIPHFALTRDEPAAVYITGIGPTDTVYTVRSSRP